ncbi:hypothetical protein ACHQM5_022367 [Ranunculus cassubicifolius]
MASVGFSYAQLHVMKNKLKEKMKRMEEEREQECKPEFKEQKLSSCFFKRAMKIHPNHTSFSKTSQ